MSIAYLSLGSNMGNKQKNIDVAIAKINNLNTCKILQVSSYIVTKAWGNTNQDDFINAACSVSTSLLPQNLLAELLNIENILGRKRTQKWGPRIIDIDIIFYNDLIINSKNLVIPHPYMHLRKFVLQPMLEINKNFVHPLLKLSIQNIYNNLNE